MQRLKVNKADLAVFTILIVFVGMACDSPPWSRFVIANSTATDITVRFYTPHPTMATPYLYSVEEWKERQHFTSGTPKERFKVDEGEGWIEAIVSPGAALEIDRASYPEVQEDIDGYFLIDRLEIGGGNSDASWTGRKEIYGLFQKEWIGPYRNITRTSPLYVFYVR